MPKIQFEDKVIHCETGANLRDELKAHDCRIHNGKSEWLNCRGFGTCGTCSVEIIGEVSPQNLRDSLRHRFPPHEGINGRRLACQTRVFGDVVIKKYGGFWGQSPNVD
ncbi:MAG: 2Fe-2S iron-sulfur cluster binding domain-containing protein [Pseudobacteriovorax sp.]|nr:2Fe-2S iron-sulfur cluster binding domain-containing protein [Pseudobacteriovorax sp.]